jgi:hypothetical protein
LPETEKPACEGCRKQKEHVLTVFPFQVFEKIVDKPLRIRGVAMVTGMSRNSNIYTPEELEAFSSKLVNAPVYIEHVSVDSAIGKVTKTEWDGHKLWYEAEIYESDVADKIRKGLIQHVSVGADYDAIDLVDANVPHGLHNAELSLVAVPGIPESNVQVMEKLAPPVVDDSELKATKEKLAAAEFKLAESLKVVEQLKLAQAESMLVSDVILILEGLLPCPAVERSSLGMVRECQAIRAAVFRLRDAHFCGESRPRMNLAEIKKLESEEK